MAAFDPDLLGEPDRLLEGDPSQMLRALATAGAQVRRALTTTRKAGALDLRIERPRAIVVAAMGADDVVADLLAALAARHSPIGVWPCHDSPLPGWVGSLDLVVAVSLSGRAPGPVRLALEAGRRGASVLTIGAPDSPLAEAAARGRGVHVPAEGTGATSRSAAWSMLTPAILALGALGVLPVDATDLDAVADRLDEIAEANRPTAEAFVSPAKILATGLGATIPLVLADGPLTGVAARRAGTMLARTARLPVMVGELPDAASQLLACLDGPYAAAPAPEGGRDIFADPYLDGPPGAEVGLLLLRDRDPRAGEEGARVRGGEAAAYDADAPRVEIGPQDAARINLAQGIVDLAERRGARVQQLSPGPGGDLVRLAELMATLDFAATYLALAHGLDPATVPALADLRDLTG